MIDYKVSKNFQIHGIQTRLIMSNKTYFYLSKCAEVVYKLTNLYNQKFPKSEKKTPDEMYKKIC